MRRVSEWVNEQGDRLLHIDATTIRLLLVALTRLFHLTVLLHIPCILAGVGIVLVWLLFQIIALAIGRC